MLAHPSEGATRTNLLVPKDHGCPNKAVTSVEHVKNFDSGDERIKSTRQETTRFKAMGMVQQMMRRMTHGTI